ncbi:MAG: DNA polymerase III subunit beta [Candidatus Omnitrophica bacterium]|nr:DNA polymerase III subunit beta [Candidatus Omnitrophota bacterium]MDD5488722.1 DNA polymerase III subunit beta [Candidatus Omnitrophota bacterium]
MEVKIIKEALVEGIQTVQNAVSQKSSLPILSNVLLEAEGNTLKLTATDLDIGICASVPVETEVAGAITVPARKFFDIIKALPDGSEISLSMKKNNFVTIKSGRAQFKIIGLPKEEFPQLPTFEDKDSINIGQGELRDIFNLTDFAVSRDDTRFVLNGVLFGIKGEKITIAATDGRRLAVVRKSLGHKTLIERDVIIPAKTVQEIKRMLSDEGDVTIKFSENQILFAFPNSFVLSRLIEGEYPNYKNVIPDKLDCVMKVQREEFLQAARRASIFTDQESMAIKLNIKKNKLTISKNTPYLGEAKEEINIDYEGNDEIEIGFNPRYLIDVLKSLSDEEIDFEIQEANKPGVVRKGEEYIYVVLPMQLTA